MECRDISTEVFALIANELTRQTRHPGEVLVIRGQHDYHGDTVLIRDNTRCMALVEDTRLIDSILAAYAHTADGTAPQRSYEYRRSAGPKRV